MDVKQLAPVLDFNFSPAGYIDPSWLTSIQNAEVVAVLAGHDVSRPWASRYILHAFGLQADADFNFSDPLKAFALGDRRGMTQVVYHAGLALNAPLLRGIVKRQERTAVEACLGQPAFSYAIKKGPFIAGALPEHFTTGFAIDWNNPDELKKHIFRTGVRLLGTVFKNEPEAYKRRLLFKFPAPSKEYFYGAGASGSNADVVRLGGIMLKKLMKEFMS